MNIVNKNHVSVNKNHVSGTCDQLMEFSNCIVDTAKDLLKLFIGRSLTCEICKRDMYICNQPGHHQNIL
jgi:hypothetical protein